MKRIGIMSLACLAVPLFLSAGVARATPVVNGATIETRTFNDCPLSTVTTTNNYPASIQITDAMSSLCVGFANLHSFSFSADGGATAAVFNNNSNFSFGADFKIDGAGEGEGGLRISPWYGKFVDGRFMANATTGEIACFGGALPFYSFTGGHAITYVRGTTIRMEVTYRAEDLYSTAPATIQYRVVYNGNTYESPELAFGIQNEAECDPNGLFGMLNDGRAGGYFQPRANTGATLSATWSNISYCTLPARGTPVANGATIEERTFNDCPLSTVTTTNNYPASVQISDAMSPLCVGFANLHSFSFSEDGGATAAVFNNNSDFSFGADFKIDGAGEGEGGLRISPWYGQYVDGRFMANATTGEIACFGGALPFYSFTGGHGITYARGTTIRMEVTYRANELVESAPATIQYRVIYNGITYDSPVLPYGKANGAECNPYGLWGMLNDGRAGGYFQPRANTGATLTATWSNITYNTCFTSVALALSPQTLNLSGHGAWVTANLEPACEIDVASLRLNGTVAVDPSAPATVSDTDNDGMPNLVVKFPRDEVAALLSTGNAVEITVSGDVGESCFETTDVIRVKSKTLDSPAAGGSHVPGSVANIDWEVDVDDPPTVDILASVNNGHSWGVVASNVTNNGRYAWTVPSVSTSNARVSVVKLGAPDAGGLVAEEEFGESGGFTIAGTTGVGDQTVALALHGIQPNPGRGSLNITFSLPNAGPAKLTIYDVAGREVASREVSGMGTGRHVVSFGQRERMAAGVYLVQLSQGGRNLKMNAVLIE